MKLTPTMLLGLERMERQLRTQSAVFASPNENTGRALHRRGLIEIVSIGVWPRYVLTDAGRAALSEERAGE